MEMVRKTVEGTIFLSQQQYTYHILERFSMSEVVPNKIHMDRYEFEEVSTIRE